MTHSEQQARQRERSARDQAEYEAMIAREFPAKHLEPWKGRVAASLLRWRWEAGMRSMTASNETPWFVLRSSRSGVSLSLSDPDQGVLIAKARKLEIGWPL